MNASTESRLTPVVDASAWSADTLDRSRITCQVDPLTRAALADSARELTAANPVTEHIDPMTLDVGALADSLNRLQSVVRDAEGLVILSGLPASELNANEYTTLIWCLAGRFGQAISQNAAGERVSAVVDASRSDPTPRAYRSNRELRLHTDLPDMLVLASYRAARQGGRSHFASAARAWNRLLESAPDALARLERGYHYHRFGEQPEHMDPVAPFRTPVFAHAGGRLSCRYTRGVLAAGHHELGLPLEEEDINALDRLDAVLAEPGAALSMMLEPGEMAVLNNYTVLHAREEFVDHDEPDKARMLVRLWLAQEGFRQVPESFDVHGTRGIPAARGRRATVDMAAVRSARPASMGESIYRKDNQTSEQGS